METTYTYKNIIKGKEVMLTAKEYEKKLLTDSDFYEYFFKSIDLIETIESEKYSNGTVLYTVKYKELDQLVCFLFGPLKNSGVSEKDDKRLPVLPATKLRNDAFYFAIGGYNAEDKQLYALLKEGIANFVKSAKDGTSYSSLWFSYDGLKKIYSEDSHLWVDGKYRSVRGFSSKIRAKQIHEEILVYLQSINRVSRKRNFIRCLGKQPLQQIFYGAPGTGKSHKTKEVTVQYKDTIRTTFHPDSDYSTFVGAYKPTTEKEYMYGLNGDKTVLFEDPSTKKPLQTSKIEYKFVKQAFLKAYIRAWLKMSKICSNTTSGALVVSSGKVTYTIADVEPTRVVCRKEEGGFPKKLVKIVWDALYFFSHFIGTAYPLLI